MPLVKSNGILVNLILLGIRIQLAGCRDVSQEQILKQLHLIGRLLWVLAVKYTDDFYFNFVSGWMFVVSVVLVGLQF